MQTKPRNSQTQLDLLNAAMALMLEKGFTATSVDEICKAAGVTKGSFFYYFETKEVMGHRLLAHFMAQMGQMLAQGDHQQVADPLQRLYTYCDDIVAILMDPRVPKSCLIGTFAQELAPTQPQVAAVCKACFAQWAQSIQADLEAACQAYPPRMAFDSYSVAEHFVTIFEGALVLAKAQQDLTVVQQNIGHFKQYVELLFGLPQSDR